VIEVVRARRLMPLVKEGFAASLTEAATRFALLHPAMSTILVGMAAPQQFEDALAAVQKGPLPPAALDRRSDDAGGDCTRPGEKYGPGAEPLSYGPSVGCSYGPGA
jgi:aryl-alcohol dehydrogenase-like predicted oxidoreductase